MPSLVIEGFKGIAPLIDPKRLNPDMAQIAKDCLLESTSLDAFPGPVDTGANVAAGTKSMYPTTAGWIESTRDMSFAKTHIANDVYKRIVYTDHENPGANASYPRVKELDGGEYRLGIPAPASAPVVTAVTAPDDSNGYDAETIYYVATYVDRYGAEGPPSAPSVQYERKIDTNVTVTLPPALTGAYNVGLGSLIRLYRSNAGTNSTAFQFAKEFAMTAGGTSVTDDTTNGQLAEVIPSVDWIGPADDDTSLYPNGAMEQVVSMANGILAGFSFKTLMFTDPFLYHAWPASYRITLDEEIVGIASIAAGLVVTTKDKPYLVTGVNPSAFAVIEIDVKQACVSKKSLVDMGQYAIYASPDGLVLVDGTTAQLITKDYFSREDWQVYWSPANLVSFLWENKYVGFNTALNKGFIFSIQDGSSAFVELSEYYDAGHYDSEDDTLYVKASSGDVFQFGRNFAAPRNFQWKSKQFVMPRPMSFSCARVEISYDAPEDNNAVTILVWGDGMLVHSETIDRADHFMRLPGDNLYRVWEVQLSGSKEVTKVTLATSPSELT